MGRRHLAVYEPAGAPPLWTSDRFAAHLDPEPPASLGRLFVRSAAPGEWLREGEYFHARGLYRQAAECFRRAGDARREAGSLAQHHEAMGEPAKAEKCPGIEGIKKEHDEFVSNESPSPEVLNAFLTGAGARTEHYEIAAYEGLITMAEAMGEAEVARLLNENLAQEHNALRKMQTISKRLAKQGATTAAA